MTSELFTRFAELEAAGTSPTYERLALAAAGSKALVGLLDELPPPKRQPNLLLAAARLAGAPLRGEQDFIAFVVSEWETVSATMLTRSTQTNEAARTGAFLPLLAAIEGPIALIEMGCSAGLCLYPDRYSICYDQRPPLVADSPVVIKVSTSGAVPIPSRRPEVVARIGVDLNPIEVTDPDGRAWLETLIWPEHEERLARLRAAASVLADDPPLLIAGDLLERLDEALSHVPNGATPVVFHSAVLNYVDPLYRSEFANALRRRPEVVWIANEGPGVVEHVTARLVPPPSANARAFFIVSRGGDSAVAISDPHGSWIRWPDGPSR